MVNAVFKNHDIIIIIENVVISEIRKYRLEIKFQNQIDSSFTLRDWMHPDENTAQPPTVELQCDLGTFSGSFGRHTMNGEFTTMEFGYLIKND